MADKDYITVEGQDFVGENFTAYNKFMKGNKITIQDFEADNKFIKYIKFREFENKLNRTTIKYEFVDSRTLEEAYILKNKY